MLSPEGHNLPFQQAFDFGVALCGRGTKRGVWAINEGVGTEFEGLINSSTSLLLR